MATQLEEKTEANGTSKMFAATEQAKALLRREMPATGKGIFTSDVDEETHVCRKFEELLKQAGGRKGESYRVTWPPEADRGPNNIVVTVERDLLEQARKAARGRGRGEAEEA